MSRAVLILMAIALLLLFLIVAYLFPRRIGPAGRLSTGEQVSLDAGATTKDFS